MYVGNPSNFGRLVHLYPTQEQFCAELNAYTVTDSAIRDTIQRTYQAHNTIICPHTAVGVYGIHSVLDSRLHWVVAATAHPAKFPDTIAKAIGHESTHPYLEQLKDRPIVKHSVESTPEAIKAFMRSHR